MTQPHAPLRCPTRDYSYPCACSDPEHRLDDLRTLISDYSRPAQRRILEFALTLPPELVSEFWRVVWIVDAARCEAEREEDALSAVLKEMRARETPEVPA